MKKPPLTKLELLESSRSHVSFLTLQYAKIRILYDVEKYQRSYPCSKDFSCDIVHRVKNNAVVIIAHKLESNLSTGSQEPALFFRSCIRPAVYFSRQEDGNLWELPAGLIDSGETPEMAAARECFEELGLKITVHDLVPLGSYSYPTVGLCGERQFFFSVCVDNIPQHIPPEDGSPLEYKGEVTSISLTEAKYLVRSGAFKDAKTELGLRRFFDVHQ